LNQINHEIKKEENLNKIMVNNIETSKNKKYNENEQVNK